MHVASNTALMKAVVHDKYGEPEGLSVGEVGRPLPGDDDVLIRVVAAGISIGDHHIVTGKPYLVRLSPFGGFPRPRHTVPGAAMSGTVEAVGAKVTGFRVGDEVFGQRPAPIEALAKAAFQRRLLASTFQPNRAAALQQTRHA